MPKVTFSKDDFLGKTPMTPGWYTLTPGEFTEKLSKDGDSTNFWGEFVVASDGEFQGTKLRHCFNEKAVGYSGGAADYMTCFTADTDKLNGMDVLEALKATTNRSVQGYCQWNPDFRRNQIEDWRAAN